MVLINTDVISRIEVSRIDDNLYCVNVVEINGRMPAATMTFRNDDDLIEFLELLEVDGYEPFVGIDEDYSDEEINEIQEEIIEMLKTAFTCDKSNNFKNKLRELLNE